MKIKALSFVTGFLIFFVHFFTWANSTVILKNNASNFQQIFYTLQNTDGHFQNAIIQRNKNYRVLLNSKDVLGTIFYKEKCCYTVGTRYSFKYCVMKEGFSNTWNGLSGYQNKTYQDDTLELCQ